jgi:hypothetical protein
MRGAGLSRAIHIITDQIDHRSPFVGSERRNVLQKQVPITSPIFFSGSWCPISGSSRRSRFITDVISIDNKQLIGCISQSQLPAALGELGKDKAMAPPLPPSPHLM